MENVGTEDKLWFVVIIAVGNNLLVLFVMRLWGDFRMQRKKFIIFIGILLSIFIHILGLIWWVSDSSSAFRGCESICDHIRPPLISNHTTSMKGETFFSISYENPV